jgi:2-C-methyl-D-erythritol 4-phosphate cytidylyltransferase
VKTYAIILAAGCGRRFGGDVSKQFLPLHGKPIFIHAIQAFDTHPSIGEIILVVPSDAPEMCKELCSRYEISKLTKILVGGNSRQESSRIAIESIGREEALVLIHDGVRPFLSPGMISRCLLALEDHLAVTLAVPASDTILQMNSGGTVQCVPDRRRMMHSQTPQGFHLRVIQMAHRRACEESIHGETDDCGLVVKFNLASVHVVDGERRNIKITHCTDIGVAEMFAEHSE